MAWYLSTIRTRKRSDKNEKYEYGPSIAYGLLDPPEFWPRIKICKALAQP